MKIRLHLTLTLFLIISSLYLNAQVIVGSRANSIVPGAEMIRITERSEVPNYLRFRQGKEIPFQNFEKWANANLPLPDNTTFKFLGKEVDGLGFTHYRFRQVINNIPVATSMWLVHVKQGQIQSMNGFLLHDMPFNNVPYINKNVARQTAIQSIGAEVFKWEIPREEAHLKEELGNPEASYFPEGELVLAPADNDIHATNFRLAYVFLVYADKPLLQKEIFIDAETGQSIFEINKIHTSDSTGIASTKYSGNQGIVSEYCGIDSFRLRESARGKGIETFNMLEGTKHGSAEDFFDLDNIWNNFNIQKDEVATDAHWGAEMTYDYFLLKHNRNSIDGNGYKLKSYVHYGKDYNNAFWDGYRMTYGDGKVNPLTTLDIAGHEITHGLTSRTADLIYQSESGALNESFSDIFATTVEFYAKSNSANWTIGEDMGYIIRSLSNPNTKNDPDTYKGSHWLNINPPCGSSNDNCGVHINSGVQNFWFYLLSQGGNGTNDHSDNYSVTAIGMDKSAKIAFRNLVYYLYPNADYADARFYSIESAKDLYGNCSPEVAATANAWYAVGVGDAYSTTPLVDFGAPATKSCTGSIHFENYSSGGVFDFTWDFGDGQTSSQLNPSHTYYKNGSYTVTLKANTCNGLDSIIKTAFINIDRPSAPDAQNVFICEPNEQAVLSVNNPNGQYNWYMDSFANVKVYNGYTITLPSAKGNEVYYIQEVVEKTSKYVGPTDNTIGSGIFFNYNQYLVFDVSSPLTLVSVKVFANGSKLRTLELRNSNGTVLKSKMAFVPDGESRITLNFEILPGKDYQLGVGGDNADLFRNSSGANYPYNIKDVISITGSSANSSSSYYYFFYDWEVKEEPCISELREVKVELTKIQSGFQTQVNGGSVNVTDYAQNAVNWFYDFGDGNTSTQQNPVHYYSGNGNYTIMQIADDGFCADTTFKTVEMQSVGVENKKIPKIHIQPNPTSGELIILLENIQPVAGMEVTVYDILGQPVFYRQFPGAINKMAHLDLSEFPAGVYLVEINCVQKKYIRRILKQ